MNTLENDFNKFSKIIPMTAGAYISTTIQPIASPTYSYALISCNEGDQFTISASTNKNDSVRVFRFFDQNSTALKSSPSNEKEFNSAVITAPENAAFLAINDNGNHVSYYGYEDSTKLSDLINSQKAISLNWRYGSLLSSSGLMTYNQSRITSQGVSGLSGKVIAVRFNNEKNYLYIFKYSQPTEESFLGYDQIFTSGEYTIPESVDTIRFVFGPKTSIGSQIPVEYSKNLSVFMSDIAESIYLMKVKGDENTLTFTSGYYMSTEGLYQTVGDWGYSNNISVIPGDVLRFINVYAVDNRAVFFYDSNDNIVGLVNGEKNTLINEIEVTVPENATYCIINTKYSLKDNTKLYKISMPHLISSNNQSIKFLNTFMNDTRYKIRKPFNQIKEKGPLFTLVDDDGRNLTQITTFHNICASNNILGCNALATKFIENMNEEDKKTFVTTLKQYELEGFQNVLHAYNHDYWQNITTSKMTDEQIFSAVTADIAMGIRQMQELGFINWQHWIVPQGKTELPGIQQIARNLGINMMYDVANKYHNSFVTKGNTFHRFNIPRMELYPTDTSNPGLTLDLIKEQAQRCAIEKGWLIVCVHCYQDGWKTNDPTFSRITEMIQYIMNLGFTNVTLSGGMSYWEDVYRLYGLF